MRISVSGVIYMENIVMQSLSQVFLKEFLKQK